MPGLTLQPLSLGPIIGATTTSTTRIWGRANAPSRSKANRAVMIARIAATQDQDQTTTGIAECTKDHDYTAVVDFNGLQPGTTYTVDIGWLEVAPVVTQINADHVNNWDVVSHGRVTTSPNATDHVARFLTGSCRHLGGDNEDELPSANPRGDRAFRTINAFLEDYFDFAVMTGDQVYADHADWKVWGPGAKTPDEFLAKYHRAFGQTEFRRFASRNPVYMTLDDHEIKNNWHNDMRDPDYTPPHKAKRNGILFHHGIRAYQIYQMSHSPLSDESHYWYTFEYGCAQFFVTDVRTERRHIFEVRDTEMPDAWDLASLFGANGEVTEDWQLVKKAGPPEIMSEEQLAALFSWLESSPADSVKFITSAVPVFPDTQKAFGDPDDKWGGFLEQRHRLLEHIRVNNIKKVLFISGDVHVSLVSVLTHADSPDFSVHNIISSAFSWPLPGLDRDNFDWGRLANKRPTTFKGEKDTIDHQHPSNYVSRNLTPWPTDHPPGHKKNNFCIVEAQPDRVTINFYFSDDERHDPFDSCEIVFL